MMQRLLATLIITVSVLFSGCSHYKFPFVYRIDVEQGNIIDDAKLEQVKVGMTKKQVEFLLGSPLIEDTFNPDRWDYFYSFQTGKGNYTRSRVTLFFDADKLKLVEKPEYETIRLNY